MLLRQSTLANLAASEAMASPERKKWQAAMQDELNLLNDNSTWTLVDRPKDRKVITGRWVYKIKTDEQGNIDKFMARCVANCFMQVSGWTFTRRMLRRANQRR